MWVQPLESLLNILRYTVSVTEGSVVGVGLPDTQESLSAAWYQYLHYYPLTYLWRATPVTLIGLVLAIPVLLRRSTAYRLVSGARWNLILLLAYVGSLHSHHDHRCKKGRPLFPAGLPAAVIGCSRRLVCPGELAGCQIPLHSQILAAVLMLGCLVLIEVLGTMRSAPYYLTYYNPLARRHPQSIGNDDHRLG